MLLAVVLSFLAVTLYSVATGRCTPPPPKEKAPVEDQEGEPRAGEPGAGEPAVGQPAPPTPTAEPAPSAPAPATDEEGPQKDHVPEQVLHVVETPELEIGFTSLGGAIQWIRLRHAFEIDKETPLDIVVPVANDLLMGQVDDTWLEPRDGAPGRADRKNDPAGPMRRWFWTRDEAAEAATPEPDVIYTFTTAGNRVWEKQWVLPEEEGRYDIHLRLSYRPPDGGVDAPALPLKVLVTSGVLREPPTGASFLYPNSAILRLSNMDEAVQMPWGIPVPEPDVNRADLRILGARTHYFLSAFYAADARVTRPKIQRWWATGEEADERPAMEEHIAAFFLEKRDRDWLVDEALAARIKVGVQELLFDWLVVDVPAKPGGFIDLALYVGPIDRHVLDQEVYSALEPVIEYRAAFDFLANALLAIYDFFRHLLGNAGVAVILMTLVVRGLMMPISIRNQLSMRRYSRKIAKIKPKLDALKQKFTNPKRLREEQSKLYREHGVGFPAGCLMLLIQLPIFFALFSSLRSEYTLRNSVFLWIGDLGGPDRLVDFGTTILDIGILTIFSINLLPLLMVGLSIWQQRMMPKPADEQQAQQMRMMKWLPIVFAVILYNYTAALALYMVFSSAMAIVESRLVRRKDADGPAPDAWPKAPEPATP